MKERFKRLPEALQKQVIYRLGAGVIFFTVYNFDIDFFQGYLSSAAGPVFCYFLYFEWFMGVL